MWNCKNFPKIGTFQCFRAGFTDCRNATPKRKAARSNRAGDARSHPLRVAFCVPFRRDENAVRIHGAAMSPASRPMSRAIKATPYRAVDARKSPKSLAFFEKGLFPKERFGTRFGTLPPKNVQNTGKIALRISSKTSFLVHFAPVAQLDRAIAS